MSAKRKNATIIGVGVAGCAACCAGPIIGLVAAIGVGTAAGLALFGALSILIGVVLMTFVLIRRQRRQVCASIEAAEPVPVELSDRAPARAS